MSKHPRVTILKGREKRALAGHPWIYANEVQMDANTKAIAPGTLVKLQVEGGAALGLATFNPHSLMCARRLFTDKVDAPWLREKLEAAQALRTAFYNKPYYRLVHAEADGLPGLIVDRYGDVLGVQANTAGMNALLPELLPVLQAVTGAKAIALNRHGAAVEQEGLAAQSEWAVGKHEGALEILENEARFYVDVIGGQKTGWFYDQRENRKLVASLCAGKKVFDGFCYAGGFGVLAAATGASAATMVDASQGALDLAKQAATANKVENRCSFIKGDVLSELEAAAMRKEKYDMVICDPPAFIKSKKDVGAGLKGYRKLARLAAAVVAPGGWLALGSCSHHAELASWAEENARGLHEAGRMGRIVYSAGAGPDHPVHPLLPESAYLKFQVCKID
jgi:23S rRNA (cytosine1962-C5)-methyltransferase